MVKFIKLESKPQTIWKSGTPTEEKRTYVAFVNPKYIISIRVGGENGTEVTVQGAMTATYWDARTPEEIIKEINKLLNQLF